MSRRDALPHARRSYVDFEEVYEDQPTRAARPSVVAPEDLAALEVTRAPRESYVALSELPQVASHAPRASYVAPSELEGGASPAMRARRSYVAPSELDGEIEEDEVTSFVDRSSMVADRERQREQGPESVTTYAVHPSYVPTSDEHSSYATSEIEEVEEIDPGAHLHDANIVSGPVDYEALSRYLFDDVAPMREERQEPRHTPDAELYADNGTLVLAPESRPPQSYPRQPATCVRQELRAGEEAPIPPVQPLATRRSRSSIHDGEPLPMRRSMPSHHSYEAAMQRFQAPLAPMPSPMPSMHPHDSSVESPWILPAAPSTRRGARTAQPEPFRITPSVIVAASVALLAATVMIAAVLFVRSDDPSDTRTSMTASRSASTSTSAEIATARPSMAAPAPPPVIVISSDDIPALAAEPAAPLPTPAVAAPAPVPTPMPVVQSTPVPVAAPTTYAAPVAAAPIARSAPATTPARAAAPAKKPESSTKGGAKTVEDILNELGEEQLRR